MKPEDQVIEKVKQTLKELNILKTAHLLIGVSGGMDSMVLLSIMNQMKYTVTAAHVNFKLRGRESDEDANFVRLWCADQHIPFLHLEVDTKAYAELHRLNTQSAAREIRYDWWNELVEKQSFEWVATGHHFDDSMETFFLNLLRGTGMKGLRGLPQKRNHFIRPMINISKAEIESYASAYSIPYRTDSSNLKEDYQRNRIRYKLIPVIQEINQNAPEVFKQVMHRIGLEWNAFEHAYASWQKINVKEDRDGVTLGCISDDSAFVLKWLEEKNIPWNLAHDFITSSKADTDKVLLYHVYRLSRIENGYYFEIVEPFQPVIISAPGSFSIGTNVLTIEAVTMEFYEMTLDPGIEYADLENVSWPLHISNITEGDYFQPIGMNGNRKKIQDYLVDLKLERHEKDKIRLLKSNDQVIWVVGRRLDERVKVNPDTQLIYRMSIK